MLPDLVPATPSWLMLGLDTLVLWVLILAMSLLLLLNWGWELALRICWPMAPATSAEN
ncbi:hypothetical protein [Hymenobacter metallicola]|uniref:hypothetical protein n=1 Tax=Hymenobacter metallicola TaxID=2563114 RepID=UPI001436B477|nr:hypothetical protein [Hymenobacter metallicola]